MTGHAGLMFGEWLLAQAEREDWIGDLARMAAGDAAFGPGCNADDLRLHMSVPETDPELFVTLDDAEREWQCGLAGIAA